MIDLRLGIFQVVIDLSEVGECLCLCLCLCLG